MQQLVSEHPLIPSDSGIAGKEGARVRIRKTSEGQKRRKKESRGHHLKNKKDQANDRRSKKKQISKGGKNNKKKPRGRKKKSTTTKTREKSKDLKQTARLEAARCGILGGVNSSLDNPIGWLRRQCNCCPPRLHTHSRTCVCASYECKRKTTLHLFYRETRLQRFLVSLSLSTRDRPNNFFRICKHPSRVSSFRSIRPIPKGTSKLQFFAITQSLPSWKFKRCS